MEPNFFELPTDKQTEIMMKAIEGSNKAQRDLIDIGSDIEHQPVDIEEELKDKFCDLADQEFPKGDKGRGQAMVLVALCLQEASQAIQDARTKAYIQGGVDEILRHEKASKAVLDHLSKKGAE